MDGESARARWRALWPVTQPLTCKDLWRIREASAERLEIIDGELFATPPSTPRHQIISGRISVAFDRVVGDGKLGEVLAAMLDVRLSRDTVVLPDIMVILRDRYRVITDWGIDGPPSLLVEIASGDLRPDLRDRGIKKEIYALYGVPEYWLVEPEKQQITVFSEPDDDQYRVQNAANEVAVSATIPGLSVDPVAMFAPIRL